MNKATLIWSLIVAVPVGASAIAAGYVYRETGKLPFQQPAATSQAPSAENESSGEQTTVAAVSPSAEQQPAQQETPAAAPQVAEETAPLEGPSFDVVGIEPTGETVVAGRSDAGAIVALTANGEVVGKSIANQAGEWTIILDAPLKPGDYDVGLEVHDEAGDAVETSQQNLVVSVPEGGNEQPLVVLNTPDQPANILQKPEVEQQVAQTQDDHKPEETQVAALPDAPASDQQAAPAVVREKPEMTENPAEKGDQMPAPAEETVAATPTPAEETSSTVAAVEQMDTPPETETAQAGSEEPAEVAEQQPQAVERDVAVAAPQPQPESPSAAQTQVSDAAPQTTPDAEAETGAQQAAAPQSSQENTEVAAVPEATEEENPAVTVEAVESEEDKVFVAGTGEPGSSVRVYVDDAYQGEAEVSSTGRWLVEGSKSVPAGDVEVRADVIADDGNSVEARAAVTFEKEAEQQIVLTKVVATGAGGAAGGQGASVEKALPKVIIRKGDNLWRISRRLYGDGVRYTTIYRANEDQIRNPDLIYPGQVFLTPEGDLSWQPKPDESEAGAGNG